MARNTNIRDNAAHRLAMPPVPIDLIWRIRLKPVPGGTVLRHKLSSSSSLLDIQRIPGETERLADREWRHRSRRIFEGLEDLLRGVARGEPVAENEISEELRTTGENLWLRLVPEKIQRAFGRYGDRIGSVLVETDDPWIPWELAIPDSRDDLGFLCCRYSIARWFSQEIAPRPDFRLRRLLGLTADSVETYPDLPHVRAERDLLNGWIGEISGLEGEIRTKATFHEVGSLLREGAFDWIHFAGHGDYRNESPDESCLAFVDRGLRVDHLGAGILRRISETRPLVFLNACRVGRQDQALTGPGGWPDRWVRLGQCGALICPQWTVRDRSSGLFAEGVYRRLRDGATLGEAVLETRRELYATDPADPSPLAYSLYGHPNAIVRLGDAGTATVRNRTFRRLRQDQIKLADRYRHHAQWK